MILHHSNLIAVIELTTLLLIKGGNNETEINTHVNFYNNGVFEYRIPLITSKL